MPLIAFGLLILFTLVLAIAMVPLTLVMRYRGGTKRRLGRSWVAALNLFSIGVSLLIFLIVAAVWNAWVPRALAYSAAGIGGGLVLGVLGLALTRWERDGPLLHYTPNRFLTLTISLIVMARIGYGFWRGWRAWSVSAADESWLAAAGVAGSLAAGGVLLGYSLIYWIGLRIRLARHARGVLPGDSHS